MPIKLNAFTVGHIHGYHEQIMLPEWLSLGENCALAANQSVDCRLTTLFTIGLNTAKV